MRRGLLSLTLLISTVPAPAALAQDDLGNGTQIGGDVQSTLALSLDTGFAPLGQSSVATAQIGAQVTATDAPTYLRVEDGDTTSSRKRGHLASGAKRLAAPLEATASSAAFQSLGSPLAPLLRSWNDAIASKPVTIKLRQRFTRAEARRGGYTKTVLVTLSAETP